MASDGASRPFSAPSLLLLQERLRSQFCQQQSVRESRVRRLCFFFEWLLQPQRLRRKFNSFSSTDDKFGSSLHFTTILLTNVSWIWLHLCLNFWSNKMAIVLFLYCVSQIESILVAQRCCFVIIHLMVRRKAGRVIISEYSWRQKLFLFPAVKKQEQISGQVVKNKMPLTN